MICGYKFDIRHIIKQLFFNILKPYLVNKNKQLMICFLTLPTFTCNPNTSPIEEVSSYSEAQYNIDIYHIYYRTDYTINFSYIK
jgi:hypothetical protein